MADEGNNTEQPPGDGVNPAWQQQPQQPPQPEGAEPHRGSMRYQDPESTTPREPSVAEQRARRSAEEREAAQRRAAAEAAERKRKIRKRAMIGGGVAVGIAAIVGIAYASQPDDVTAYCTGSDNTVGNDQYCDRDYVYSHGGYINPGGIIFLPGPGGITRQYHYNYGGSVSNGRVTGGSATKPDGANINTRSGKSIQRGGIGVGGGSKGGSSGSRGGSSGS